MGVLQIRWKLASCAALCTVFLAAAFKVGKPVSFANAFGSFCIFLFAGAILVMTWAWFRLPQLMNDGADPSPETIASDHQDERYGPTFPIGRYDDMHRRASSIAGSEETEHPLTLSIALGGTTQVLRFAEIVYHTMWQSALDYSACVDQLRSSDAAAEAADFLLLRTVQQTLAELYEQETGSEAFALEIFRLPEQNIGRQEH